MGQKAKLCSEISSFDPVKKVLVQSKKFWFSPKGFGSVQRYWTHPKHFWTYRRDQTLDLAKIVIEKMHKPKLYNFLLLI